MVISQPPGNNPSYYYRKPPTFASIVLNASRVHLYVLYMQLQHQGNSGNGKYTYILHESDPRSGITVIGFFIHFVAPRLLFISG